MAIQTKCNGCGRVVKGGDDWAGRTAKCPECSAPITFVRTAVPPPTSTVRDDGFDDAIAEEQRVATIVQKVDPLPAPAYLPPAADTSRSTPQKVIITRIKLPLGNMVELVIGFWIASLIAGIVIAVVLAIIFGTLGVSFVGAGR